jgi:hypothetical protein
MDHQTVLDWIYISNLEAEIEADRRQRAQEEANHGPGGMH